MGNLQCHVSFRCTAKWFSYTYLCIYSLSFFPYRILWSIEYTSLCYTVGPCWFSISYLEPQQDGRCWSGSCVALKQPEEIPHDQGQRRSPNKMVGGVKSCLESNPIPTRDVQRAQTNLVPTRTQRPHRDWARTAFECLLWRYRSAVACRRDRVSGCSRPGCDISPLGGVCR